MLKDYIKDLIKKALGTEVDFDIFSYKERLGDYSTNIGFLIKDRSPEDMVGVFKSNPELIKIFKKIEIAGKGFINFYFSEGFLKNSLAEVLKKGVKYFKPKIKKQKINIEFVSANPTGPLTLGNGRSATYGNSLANILLFIGHKAAKEYFINDVGNQVEKLGESIARRYLQLKGVKVDYPEDLYQGEYITDIAREMIDKRAYHGPELEENLELLKESARDFAIEYILREIKETLAKFGVGFDIWFSEKKFLHDSGETQDVLNLLEFNKMSYKSEGAVWFKATDYGLDQDVVIKKSTGQTTYLLSDFGYAQNKLKRGFNKNIYILGADHHADVARLTAGISALGLDEKKFVFLLHQLVALKRGPELLRMSKRKATFITLEELMKEVGPDAIKYFFLAKSLDNHIEFDLALAKEESAKNPIFYIQYAHARIASLIRKAKEEKIKIPKKFSKGDFNSLKHPSEFELIKLIIKLPDLLLDVSQNYQVHHLANYALSLARTFHGFYDNLPVLKTEENERRARLGLVLSTGLTLKTILNLMSISAPESM